MDANKKISCYEEALASITEMKHNIDNLYAIIESDDKLIVSLRRIIEKQNAVIKTDEKMIANYERLIELYQKELADK